MEQTDVSLSELRAELDRQMNLVSSLGVKLSESQNHCQQLDAKLNSEETQHRQQVRHCGVMIHNLL